MNEKKEFPIKQIIILICLFITLLVLFSLLRQRVIANSNQVNDVRYAKLLNIIAYLDRQIEKNPPSSEARNSFEYRKKYFEWQVTQLAKPTEPLEVMVPRKQTSIALSTDNALHRTPMPTPTRRTGILDDPQYERYVSNEAKMAYKFWVGKVGDTYVKVYSGSLWDDPSQGVIYVFQENTLKWLKFPTPTIIGVIEIDDFNGNRLTFSNENGDQIFFDVAALKFANSADEYLPTATNGFSTLQTPYPGP